MKWPWAAWLHILRLLYSILVLLSSSYVTNSMLQLSQPRKTLPQQYLKQTMVQIVSD
jgi:hypothetical protein